jgi:hypothetical protein
MPSAWESKKEIPAREEKTKSEDEEEDEETEGYSE